VLETANILEDVLGTRKEAQIIRERAPQALTLAQNPLGAPIQAKMQGRTPKRLRELGLLMMKAPLLSLTTILCLIGTPGYSIQELQLT
jgi:hypothetical protein